jgi:hypothetical protein
VRWVYRYPDRSVEEQLLGLGLCNFMQFPVLGRVAGIPLEASASGELVGEAGHS